jgi:excisionase family DNA binding protein
METRRKSKGKARFMAMENFYTADQLARVLSVTPVWIYKLVREGKIPFVRVASKCVRFKESEIEAWLNEGRGKAYHRDKWREAAEDNSNMGKD